jgi:hypothetical protein
MEAKFFPSFFGCGLGIVVLCYASLMKINSSPAHLRKNSTSAPQELKMCSSKCEKPLELKTIPGDFPKLK